MSVGCDRRRPGVQALPVLLASAVALSFLSILSATIVCPAEHSGIRLAPLNPAYLKYKAEKEAAGTTVAPEVSRTPGGRKFGYIPSRIDFSYLCRSAKSAVGPEIS